MKARTDYVSHFKEIEVGGDPQESGNGVKISPAAASATPGLTVVGDDTNVSLKLVPKGTGKVRAGAAIVEPATVTTETTAGNVTYTAAQLLGGLILRDPNGAGRNDVTPTAALIIAAIPDAQVGDSFEFTIRNTADAAETITVTAGTNVTLSGTMTIAQNNSKRFLVRVDSATAATIYSLGTVVH